MLVRQRDGAEHLRVVRYGARLHPFVVTPPCYITAIFEPCALAVVGSRVTILDCDGDGADEGVRLRVILEEAFECERVRAYVDPVSRLGCEFPIVGVGTQDAGGDGSLQGSRCVGIRL